MNSRQVDLYRYRDGFIQRKRGSKTISGYASSLRTCGNVIIKNRETKFDEAESFPLTLEADGSVCYINHP